MCETLTQGVCVPDSQSHAHTLTHKSTQTLSCTNTKKHPYTIAYCRSVQTYIHKCTCTITYTYKHTVICKIHVCTQLHTLISALQITCAQTHVCTCKSHAHKHRITYKHTCTQQHTFVHAMQNHMYAPTHMHICIITSRTNAHTPKQILVLLSHICPPVSLWPPELRQRPPQAFLPPYTYTQTGPDLKSTRRCPRNTPWACPVHTRAGPPSRPAGIGAHPPESREPANELSVSRKGPLRQQM